MDLNPFSELRKAAEKKAAEIYGELVPITSSIEWYKTTKRSDLLRQRDDLEANLASLDSERKEAEARLVSLRRDRCILSIRINSLLNPLNWFNASQRRYRAQYRALEIVIADAERSLKRHDGVAFNIEQQRIAKLKEITDYDSFNLSAHQTTRKALLEEFVDANNEALQLKTRFIAVDKKLKSFMQQMRELDGQRDHVAKSLAKATRLEAKLGDAETPREKAMVHNQCEETFGIGQPQKVMRLREKELASINRRYAKLSARARNVARIASREVRRLIIDGNNLCYEGDNFIGLDALCTLVPVLCEKHSVQVVFDASIRRILSSGTSEIRGVFGEAVEVHVVATSEKADETVLELAGQDERAYVISNDRFSEFREKPAVKQGRIIRHEIVGGQVFVHELEISEQYREA